MHAFENPPFPVPLGTIPTGDVLLTLSQSNLIAKREPKGIKGFRLQIFAAAYCCLVIYLQNSAQVSRKEEGK